MMLKDANEMVTHLYALVTKAIKMFALMFHQAFAHHDHQHSNDQIFLAIDHCDPSCFIHSITDLNDIDLT